MIDMTTATGARAAEAIELLFLAGHAMDHVVAAGLVNGWIEDDVRAVLREQEWDLDASGRIPRHQRKPRTTTPPGLRNLPPGPLGRPAAPRGVPAATPPMPRPAVAPPPGTVTAAPATLSVAQLTGRTMQADIALADPDALGIATRLVTPGELIARGREHTRPVIRTRAARAQKALDDLRLALADADAADQAAAQRAQETENARRRLAELEAEADELRTKLRGELRRPSKQASGLPGRPLPPIEHGTRRGAHQHIARREKVCAECKPPLDAHMAKLRGLKQP